jgi:hypothetical protein
VSNRETWLATALAPAFETAGKPIPPTVKLSCGFPSRKGKAIGECHYPATEEAYTEIFIRPDQHDPIEVAAIALHELCHAALGPGFNHGKEFRKLATALGLVGPMRSTEPGPKAVAILQPIIDRLGPYPHKPLRVFAATRAQAAIPHKNLNCPECGFHAKVRLDQMSWGRLVCPVDNEMLLLREEKEEAGL